MGYDWPGNVRELEHTVEHAFVLCHGNTIEEKHLPREIRSHASTLGTTATKTPSQGRQEIEEALTATDWNVAKAARRLGIGRRTIYRRIKKYHLQRPVG
jgi:transcriptional regulator of acetoin/glycerol metabolism